jgi:hypothetical protein
MRSRTDSESTFCSVVYAMTFDVTRISDGGMVSPMSSRNQHIHTRPTLACSFQPIPWPLILKTIACRITKFFGIRMTRRQDNIGDASPACVLRLIFDTTGGSSNSLGKVSRYAVQCSSSPSLACHLQTVVNRVFNSCTNVTLHTAGSTIDICVVDRARRHSFDSPGTAYI